MWWWRSSLTARFPASFFFNFLLAGSDLRLPFFLGRGSIFVCQFYYCLRRRRLAIALFMVGAWPGRRLVFPLLFLLWIAAGAAHLRVYLRFARLPLRSPLFGRWATHCWSARIGDATAALCLLLGTILSVCFCVVYFVCYYFRVLTPLADCC